MREGKVQMGVTRSPSRDQESLLPAENWENTSPKTFGQPSLCSRHFLEPNLVLKEISCPSYLTATTQRQHSHGQVYSQHTQCQCTESICPGLLERDTDPAMPQSAPSHTLTHLISSIWWKEAAEGACSAPLSALSKMPPLESQGPVPAVARKGGWA